MTPVRVRKGLAVVGVGVLPVMASADHRSERVSEAAFGTPVRVLPGASAEWAKIRLPDGYAGHARRLGLVPVSAARFRKFLAAPRILEACASIHESPGGQVRLRIPAGSRVAVTRRVRGWSEVVCPDGSRGYLRGTPHTRPPKFSLPMFLRIARGLVGVPYTWGGRTSWGLDCSGFIQLAAELAGGKLPRDARDQFRAGRAVGGSRAEVLRPGDLLFFGHDETVISHGCIYIGRARYLHSFGWVRIQSLRPQDPDYLPDLMDYFRGARRLSAR